ncbi:hypothetical protein CVT25_015593 [Psilocybe cyanescens]|uniref:Uncharacterized protein n=1 Tax=Psilocybe cyanescens TaxID=93625 RepID=A0A409WHM9_PSICY|nr:hypothetical protein CVT25_015593 [Psilocybe cyanescens]
MPFKVTNPERPIPHSRSSSSSSIPMPPDRASLRSFVSSSEHTAFSDPKKSLDEELPGYIDNRTVATLEKILPPVPQYEKQKSREDYDPYAGDSGQSSSSSSHTDRYPLTTVAQLTTALGPDNVPYSTEIETVPCSGVRIPFGPLTGLLAWRLVVRTPPVAKGKGGWWFTNTKKEQRRSSYDPPNFPPPPQSAPHSDTPKVERRLSSRSTASLPMLYGRNLASTPEPMPRPSMKGHSSATLTRQAHVHSYSHSEVPLPAQPSVHHIPASSSNAVVTNFILDTSLPYSIISRDTLIALGYPAHRLPAPGTSNTDTITLTVQNVVTKLRIARPGEASRLGVQFLHDTGVSVFFPRNGEGVGPVLYLESARLLKDVPRTITSLPGGARGIGMPKATLQQRVRALFGLG